MGSDLRAAIRPALLLLPLFTLLLGIGYPLLTLAIGQTVFPHQANGSLIRDGDRVVGSELIGQAFAGPSYFHPRPSAAGKGYDAAASSGSNLGPTSQALAERIRTDVASQRSDGVTGAIPADMVTASGSGLDPHVSPAAALVQVRRVAGARGLPEAQVRALVERAVRQPTLGILGEPHVNILLINRQLDGIAAQSPR